jgi:RHS repeat-associated protein
LSGVTHDPFGPATGWTWGNSSTVSRTYNEDGDPSQIVTAGVTNAYTVDAAHRIKGISDSGLSSNSITFSYDDLDEVLTATTSAITQDYKYDANGNREFETGTFAYNATTSTTSNRILSTTKALVRTYGYDNAGNTTSYTGAGFTFNDRGRMSTAVTGGGTTNYIYNALGQLIEKSGNGGTTLLVYDESGHLLGEYSSTGALIQETIWMGDLPVATLRPNGSSITIYYIHTDQLGTPRKITNPSGNTVVWRWDPNSFGSAAPSIATITYNQRFPGQYYLPESGLYYNYYRTYDPQTGRYIESDPIGMHGGINTYTYVRGSPVSLIDLLGLCPPSNPDSRGVQSVLGPESLPLLAAALDGAAASVVDFIADALGLGTAHPPTIEDLLTPGGAPLGTAGSNPTIREVTGDLSDAQSLFDQLAEGGTPVQNSNYPGTLVNLPNGGTVGLRTVMTNSPDSAATIDVNISNIPITKIKVNP